MQMAGLPQRVISGMVRGAAGLWILNSNKKVNTECTDTRWAQMRHGTKEVQKRVTRCCKTHTGLLPDLKWTSVHRPAEYERATWWKPTREPYSGFSSNVFHWWVSLGIYLWFVPSFFPSPLCISTLLSSAWRAAVSGSFYFLFFSPVFFSLCTNVDEMKTATAFFNLLVCRYAVNLCSIQ